MSVLIVDDMPNMSKSVRGMMKVLEFGDSFHFATNGKEGWELLNKQPYDLAIIDWNMPVMTGIELLELIRKDVKFRDMPVVMITAESTKDIVAEAAESDIDAYILKPITVKSLGDKIREVIDSHNHPPEMVTRLKSGRDLIEKGDYDNAILEIEHAIKAEPDSTRPIRELGYVYYRMGDLEKAETYFLEAAEKNKLDVFAFHYLGELYLKQNDIEKAAKFINKAVDISPRHVDRSVNLGKILVKNNDLQKASNVFSKAISLSDKPMVLKEEIANFCYDNKVYSYAIKLFRSLHEQKPDRADILYKLGITNGLVGEYSQAIEYLKKADVNADPEVKINIKINLAKNYLATSQVLRADTILSEAIKLDPDNEEIRELLRQNV